MPEEKSDVSPCLFSYRGQGLKSFERMGDIIVAEDLMTRDVHLRQHCTTAQCPQHNQRPAKTTWPFVVRVIIQKISKRCFCYVGGHDNLSR